MTPSLTSLQREPVWITDMATYTAPGEPLSSLWERLMDGKTAIRAVERFSCSGYKARKAAVIPDLKPGEPFSMMHDLLDRILEQLGPVPADAAVVTGTTKAGIDNLERIRNNSHADDADLLLSSLPDAVARKLNLAGSGGINVSAACASSTLAVARAAGMITSGETDAVIVACLDLVTEFVFSGFSSIGALAPETCKPFDKDRDGLALGEGGAALVLMNPSRARKENRPCLARITGWGSAGDAAHITAPARDGSGLIRAVSMALDMANLAPDQVAAILAHGTGTVYNDAMELTAFEHLFQNRDIPILSVKGAIGHTLGAAGGIEVAAGGLMLSHQTVPPTVGCTLPEDRAKGKVCKRPTSFSGDCLLSTNSGFGGINAAIIMEKGTEE